MALWLNLWLRLTDLQTWDGVGEMRTKANNLLCKHKHAWLWLVVSQMEFRQLWSDSEPVMIKICSQTMRDKNDLGISLILLTSYKNNLSIDLEGGKIIAWERTVRAFKTAWTTGVKIILLPIPATTKSASRTVPLFSTTAFTCKSKRLWC